MPSVSPLIIRSSRRSVSLEIRPDGVLVVRAPDRMKDGEIRRFLDEKAGWIERHLEKVRRTPPITPDEWLTEEQLDALRRDAARVIPERVRHFASLVGVTFGRITIRCQKSKWGSCSAAGNLNFNCLLMLAPPEVLDYIVVHELCHRLEMNHSAAFYRHVARVLPDWCSADAWLKANGARLMRRMTEASER